LIKQQMSESAKTNEATREFMKQQGEMMLELANTLIILKKND
jgi:hypothetical protein